MTISVPNLSRRELLQAASAGFGYLAFAGMSTQAAEAESQNPLGPKQPHFAAKAKRVIFLCMQGGPSHVDTFDYKPQLAKDAGKGSKYGGSRLMASPWEFRQRGQSGLWISDLFPNVAKHADEMPLPKCREHEVWAKAGQRSVRAAHLRGTVADDGWREPC